MRWKIVNSHASAGRLITLSAGGALGGHLSYAQGGGVHRWQPPQEVDAAAGDGFTGTRLETVPAPTDRL